MKKKKVTKNQKAKTTNTVGRKTTPVTRGVIIHIGRPADNMTTDQCCGGSSCRSEAQDANIDLGESSFWRKAMPEFAVVWAYSGINAARKQLEEAVHLMRDERAEKPVAAIITAIEAVVKAEAVMRNEARAFLDKNIKALTTAPIEYLKEDVVRVVRK